MARVWTPDELARLTPEEDQALFDASVARDVSEIPPATLERLRGKIREREGRDVPHAS